MPRRIQEPDVNQTRPGCRDGRHKPRYASQRMQGSIVRTTCADCGCNIRKSAFTRNWVYFGVLA